MVGAPCSAAREQGQRYWAGGTPRWRARPGGSGVSGALLGAALCSCSCPVEEPLKQRRRRRGLGGRQMRSRLRPTASIWVGGREGALSFSRVVNWPRVSFFRSAKPWRKAGGLGARRIEKPSTPASRSTRSAAHHCQPATRPAFFVERNSLIARSFPPREQRAASKVIEPSASLGPVCAKPQRSLPRGPSSRCFAARASRDAASGEAPG